MTALDVTSMSEHEARQITERIRAIAVTAKEQLEKLQRLLEEARDGNAWVALGYASWTSYLADVMGDQPLRLPRDQRQEIVGYLAGEGMSVRAIAPLVGASKSQVAEDVRGVQNWTPAPQELPDESVPAPHDSGDAEPGRGEVTSFPSPRPVTGLDGKTYERPAPKPAVTQDRPSSAMSATEAEQDRQRQETESLARALLTLSAFAHPSARQRYRDSWAAQPYARNLAASYYNPKTIRELAKHLTTFANELGAS